MAAAVVKTVLAKRGGGRDDASAWDGQGEPPRPLNKKWHAEKKAGSSTMVLREAMLPLPQETHKAKAEAVAAVKRVQRVWRGFVTRAKLRALIQRASTVSPDAVQAALFSAREQYAGCRRLMCFLALLVLFIAMALAQVFYYRPTAFSVNDGLAQFLAEVSFPLTSVTSPREFFSFAKAVKMLVDSNYLDPTLGGGNTMPPGCAQILADYCTLNLTDTNAYNGSAGVLQERAGECASHLVTANTGYLDATNRMLVSLFLLQRRYTTTPCLPSVQARSPFRNVKSRPCLNATQAAQFTSALCGNASHPTKADCYRFPEFTLDNNTLQFTATVFATTTSTASTSAAIGSDSASCRLDELERLQWLDAATQSVCLAIITFTDAQQGRYAIYRGCASFDLGGRVSYSQDLSSLALMSPGTMSLADGLTWGFLAMTACWGVYLVRRIWLSVYDDDVTWRSVVSWANAFDVVLFSLSVACVARFFTVAREIEAYAFPPISVNVYINPSAYFPSLLQLQSLFQQWQAYVSLVCLTMFAFCLDFFDVIHFHHTTGFVTQVLHTAAKELVIFSLVFFAVLIMFATLGVLFFGNSFPEYSTLALAMNQLMYINTFNFDPTSDYVFDSEGSSSLQMGRFDSEALAVLQQIWFWMYVILSAYILLSVLLSVIVGAFMDIQTKGKDRAQSYSWTTMCVFCMSFLAQDFCAVCLLLRDLTVVAGGKARSCLCGSGRNAGQGAATTEAASMPSPLRDCEAAASGPTSPAATSVSGPPMPGDGGGVQSMLYMDPATKQPRFVDDRLQQLRGRHLRKRVRVSLLCEELGDVFPASVVPRVVLFMRCKSMREEYLADVTHLQTLQLNNDDVELKARAFVMMESSMRTLSSLAPRLQQLTAKMMSENARARVSRVAVVAGGEEEEEHSSSPPLGT